MLNVVMLGVVMLNVVAPTVLFEISKSLAKEAISLN
jgi:hypothetical protein